MNTEIEIGLKQTTSPSLESDLQLAIMLAKETGKLLLSLQFEAQRDGISAEKLKILGDQLAQEYLAHALADNRPDDHVLSEEAEDDPHRAVLHRVWIIDPLDGTREFSEGREDWAVHVALWELGQMRCGAVALPGLCKTLDSGCGQPLPPRRSGPLRFAVSRTRASSFVLELAALFDAELVPMGSAGFKAGAVVEGDVDVYVHSGGQYEWDSAAPVAVALSRGLHASRIDGSELLYNQLNPYLPDLLICRPELAITLLDGIRTLGGPIDYSSHR